jgi:hypothetical protein
VLFYNITFALSKSYKTIDVTAYACVAAVQVTQDGKATLRTGNHCTLLAAVRKVLPASAVTTQQDSPGGRRSRQFLAGQASLPATSCRPATFSWTSASAPADSGS